MFALLRVELARRCGDSSLQTCGCVPELHCKHENEEDDGDDDDDGDNDDDDDAVDAVGDDE
eukprot:1411275-Karenia_brevis.AAC.1